MVGFMGGLLGNGNLISQTPPGLSYDNEAVGVLWGTMRKVANAGLAVVSVWGGVNLMTRATRISRSFHACAALRRTSAASNPGAAL